MFIIEISNEGEASLHVGFATAEEFHRAVLERHNTEIGTGNAQPLSMSQKFFHRAISIETVEDYNLELSDWTTEADLEIKTGESRARAVLSCLDLIRPQFYPDVIRVKAPDEGTPARDSWDRFMGAQPKSFDELVDLTSQRDEIRRLKRLLLRSMVPGDKEINAALIEDIRTELGGGKS